MNAIVKCSKSAIITILMFTVCLTQGPPVRDQALEKKIHDELKNVSPKSVQLFKDATSSMDKNNHEEAIRLYKSVLEQAPDFEHALRRIGYSYSAVGMRKEAIETTERALKINRSSMNLIGAASIRASFNNENYKPSQSDLRSALAYAKEAVQQDNSGEPDAALLVAELSLRVGKAEEFEKAVGTLNEKFPDEMGTHYFSAVNFANNGEFSKAEAEIKEAQKLGLPTETAQQFLTAIETAKSEQYFGMGDYIYYGFWLVCAWILGLAALFIGGKVLSVRTLMSIENSDPNDIYGEEQKGLKGVYRKVITISGVYYYVSQPILVLVIIALAVGITVAFFYIGRIPVYVLLAMWFAALASIFYMVKSLVFRQKVEDPGRVLPEQEAPELWSLVKSVANDINTRPVDEIRITHGAELAVYERGGIRAKMQDKGERILILGLAVMDGFSQNAFRAVLAHEYGHFSNRDTAGGDIAFHVNNDIVSFAESMAISGTATWYNIAFQFLRFYHFLFRRITHGASRLQEVLADRVAVHQFGEEAFREGLKHVILRDIEFNHLAEKEIGAALTDNRPMKNLYELKIEDEMTVNDVALEFKEHLSAETTEDDTHPSPKDRFKLIENIRPKDTAAISGAVWDLFTNREELTIEMNSMLEESLRQQQYE